MTVSPFIKNENSILLEEMLVYRLYLHMEAHGSKLGSFCTKWMSVVQSIQVLFEVHMGFLKSRVYK